MINFYSFCCSLSYKRFLGYCKISWSDIPGTLINSRNVVREAQSLWAKCKVYTPAPPLSAAHYAHDCHCSTSLTIKGLENSWRTRQCQVMYFLSLVWVLLMLHKLLLYIHIVFTVYVYWLLDVQMWFLTHFLDVAKEIQQYLLSVCALL